MDDVRARENEDTVQLDGLIVEEEPLDNATRRYLAYLTRIHPFSVHFDAPAPLIKQELAIRWPIERGTEQQASALRHQIEHFIEPLVGKLHPATPVRLIVNVGSHPEMQLPFPDAPAVYAAFDAARGVVRHRLVAPNKIPLDAWVDTVSRGLMLLCQPVETKHDPEDMRLTQGDNLYELAPLELNQMAEWRRLHNRSVIVPMMPPTAKAFYEETPDTERPSSFTEKAALAGASLFALHEIKGHESDRANAAETARKYQEAAQERQKEDDAKTAEKTKHDAESLEEKTAMAETETLLNEVRRDERLIRENPDLSSKLAALRESAGRLRGVLTDDANRGQAEADIRAAESEYIIEKETETAYDESSNPQQIFLQMPEKETEVQESEQAREDAEHFPEEITQAGEYARIADLNPDAAEELTAEEPGLEHEAVREDMLPAGADMLHENDAGEAGSASTEEPASTVGEAANEVTLSPEAAAERAAETTPEATASRAAESLTGSTEAPETTESGAVNEPANATEVAERMGEAAPEAERAEAESLQPEGQTETAAPESKIAEPEAAVSEPRELQGGAPVNEAGEVIQNEPPAARAEELQPSQEEPQQEDPITEKAKEQMRDEVLQPSEPESAPETERITPNSGSETTAEAAPERESTSAETMHAATESQLEEARQAQTTAEPQETTGEDHVTQKVQEQMRDEVLQPSQESTAFERTTPNSGSEAQTASVQEPASTEATRTATESQFEAARQTQTAAEPSAQEGMEHIQEHAAQEAMQPSEERAVPQTERAGRVGPSVGTQPTTRTEAEPQTAQSHETASTQEAPRENCVTERAQEQGRGEVAQPANERAAPGAQRAEPASSVETGPQAQPAEEPAEEPVSARGQPARGAAQADEAPSETPRRSASEQSQSTATEEAASGDLIHTIHHMHNMSEALKYPAAHTVPLHAAAGRYLRSKPSIAPTRGGRLVSAVKAKIKSLSRKKGRNAAPRARPVSAPKIPKTSHRPKTPAAKPESPPKPDPEL